jgi:HK97 gp10 family phage protein
VARVYLKGLPRLKAKLVRLKEQTMPEIRGAMEHGAEKIAEMMRSLVPVDDGDLRASIGWTWGEAPKGSFSVSSNVGSNKITIFAGNEKAFYARWVEFGTAPHAQGGQHAGTEHPGNRAQPFFFPSYRANKRGVKALLRKAIREAVRKAVR